MSESVEAGPYKPGEIAATWLSAVLVCKQAVQKSTPVETSFVRGEDRVQMLVRPGDDPENVSTRFESELDRRREWRERRSSERRDPGAQASYDGIEHRHGGDRRNL